MTDTAPYSPRAAADFIERAMRGIDSMPLAERAAAHLVAATVLAPIDPDAAEVARAAAGFLREADAHQARLFETLTTL